MVLPWSDPADIFVADTSMLLNEVVEMTRGQGLTSLLMALRSENARVVMAPHVPEEFERTLPHRVGPDDDLNAVLDNWRKLYLPRLRVVPVPTSWAFDDQRVDRLAARDSTDVDSLRLAIALSPSVLLAEDRDFAGAATGRDWLNTIHPATARGQQDQLVMVTVVTAKLLSWFTKSTVDGIGRLPTFFKAGLAIGGVALSLRPRTRDQFTAAVSRLVRLVKTNALEAMEPLDLMFSRVADRIAFDSAIVHRSNDPTMSERIARVLVLASDFTATIDEIVQLLTDETDAPTSSDIRSTLLRHDSAFTEVESDCWTIGEAGNQVTQDFTAAQLADFHRRFFASNSSGTRR